MMLPLLMPMLLLLMRSYHEHSICPKEQKKPYQRNSFCVSFSLLMKSLLHVNMNKKGKKKTTIC